MKCLAMFRPLAFFLPVLTVLVSLREIKAAWLIFYVTILFMAWLLINQINEFDLLTVLFALKILFITLVIEASILSLICLLRIKYKKYSRFLGVFTVITTLIFLGINIFSFALATLDLSHYVSFALSFVIAAIALILYLHLIGRKFLIAFAVSLILIATVNAVNVSVNNRRNMLTLTSQNEMLTKTYTKNFYIIFFDALVSEKAFKQIYQQSSSPAWVDLFGKKDFRVIGDAISGGEDTWSSFATTFNFGHKNVVVQMTGENNVVYDYFRKAGYKISFLSEANYFGSGKNLNLDYLYPEVNEGKACAFAPKYFLFNACNSSWVRSSAPQENSIEAIFNGFRQHINTRDSHAKWLTTMYISYPQHSPGPDEYLYDGGNKALAWRKDYVSRIEGSTILIGKIVDEILKKDGRSVIVILGDHGSWYYRGVPDKGNANIDSDRVKLDKYGVTFAIYPKDICDSSISGEYAAGFIFKDIIKCGALLESR